MNIANLELLTKLYQGMSAEQEQYWDWFLDQPPDKILILASDEHFLTMQQK